ncbi:MAG: 16S rRNA (guanine(527)-N(7))-methyltransferase RsmG [Pirellulales bacterium]
MTLPDESSPAELPDSSNPSTEMDATPAIPVSATLEEALAKAGIELPANQVKLIDGYVRRLWAWNEKINLTRHTDYDKFVGRDLADSMQLAKLLHPEEEILDVGTGGGVPGLLIAILRPDVTVHLCDSVQKKVRVVQEIAKELKLPVTVIADRAESQLRDYRYDAIVSRAVGPIAKMLTWFKPFWASIGRLLLVKGPRWEEEKEEARSANLLPQLQVKKVAEYPMPGTESNSVIIKVWHRGAPEK